MTVGVRNISPLGAGVVGLLRVGRRGFLRFMADGVAYDLPAMAVWADPEEGVSGLRFVRLSDADSMRIAKLNRAVGERKKASPHREAPRREEGFPRWD